MILNRRIRRRSQFIQSCKILYFKGEIKNVALSNGIAKIAHVLEEGVTTVYGQIDNK